MVNHLSFAGSVIRIFLFASWLSVIMLPFSFGFIRKPVVSEKSPVILIPGLGGSQLEAKLDKTHKSHPHKKKESREYHSMWVNVNMLLPQNINHWANDVRLVYDNVTRTTSDAPGIHVTVPGFGSTEVLELLTSSKMVSYKYFYSIVEALTEKGYSRGINIKGAPYDFRRAPNELDGYYRMVKNMTEETYRENGNKRLTFICHSLGCPVILYFFNHQTQKWKDTYVKALLTLNSPWGGTVRVMYTYLYGEDFGVSFLNPIHFRKVLRSFPSVAFMMPSDMFWSENEVLVETHTKNYTTGNVCDFFTDIDFLNGWEMYKDTYNLTCSLVPPGVEVHCLCGIGENTIERLIYDKGNFPDGDVSAVYGDGDGKVNLRSLQGCLRFKGKQKHPVHYMALPNVDHQTILLNDQVLSYMLEVLDDS